MRKEVLGHLQTKKVFSNGLFEAVRAGEVTLCIQMSSPDHLK